MILSLCVIPAKSFHYLSVHFPYGKNLKMTAFLFREFRVDAKHFGRKKTDLFQNDGDNDNHVIFESLNFSSVVQTETFDAFSEGTVSISNSSGYRSGFDHMQSPKPKSLTLRALIG